jgi:hypothetical protein
MLPTGVDGSVHNVAQPRSVPAETSAPSVYEQSRSRVRGCLRTASGGIYASCPPAELLSPSTSRAPPSPFVRDLGAALMDHYTNYDKQRQRDPASLPQPYFAVPQYVTRTSIGSASHPNVNHSANLSLTIPTELYSYAPLSADGYSYSPVEPRSGTGYYLSPTMSPSSPADYRSPITPADYATSFGPAVVTSPSSTHSYGYYGSYSEEVPSTSHGLYGVGFEVSQPPQKGSEPQNHV